MRMYEINPANGENWAWPEYLKARKWADENCIRYTDPFSRTEWHGFTTKQKTWFSLKYHGRVSFEYKLRGFKNDFIKMSSW